MAWFENFDKSWNALKHLYDERFYRMWKYYLLACAGSFRARKNQLWQIVLSKGGLRGGWSMAEPAPIRDRQVESGPDGESGSAGMFSDFFARAKVLNIFPVSRYTCQAVSVPRPQFDYGE